MIYSLDAEKKAGAERDSPTDHLWEQRMRKSYSDKKDLYSCNLIACACPGFRFDEKDLGVGNAHSCAVCFHPQSFHRCS
jgi:hypothetical protein